MHPMHLPKCHRNTVFHDSSATSKETLVNIVKQCFIHSQLHTRELSGLLLKFFMHRVGKSCLQTTYLHCLLCILNITISYSRLCINGLSVEACDAWRLPKQTANSLHPSRKSTCSLLKHSLAEPIAITPWLVNLKFRKYFFKTSKRNL